MVSEEIPVIGAAFFVVAAADGAVVTTVVLLEVLVPEVIGAEVAPDVLV